MVAPTLNGAAFASAIRGRQEPGSGAATRGGSHPVAGRALRPAGGWWPCRRSPRRSPTPTAAAAGSPAGAATADPPPGSIPGMRTARFASSPASMGRPRSVHRSAGEARHPGDLMQVRCLPPAPGEPQPPGAMNRRENTAPTEARAGAFVVASHPVGRRSIRGGSGQVRRGSLVPARITGLNRRWLGTCSPAGGTARSGHAGGWDRS
jgi:hypothetical protein